MYICILTVSKKEYQIEILFYQSFCYINYNFRFVNFNTYFDEYTCVIER